MNNNPVRQPDPDEEIPLTAADLEEIEELDSEALEEIEATSPIPAVQEVVKKAAAPPIPKEKSWKFPDSEFENPLSESSYNLIPKNVSVLSGNLDEERTISGKIGKHEFAAITNKGPSEYMDHMDDACFVNENNNEFGVCDGLGGQAAGYIASQVSIWSVINNPKGSLEEKMVKANQDVNAFQAANEIYNNTANTMTMANLEDGNANLSVVGDTYGMLIRNGKVVQHTEEQSALRNYMTISKKKTESEFKKYAIENKLVTSEEEADNLIKSLSTNPGQAMGGNVGFDYKTGKTPEGIVIPETYNFKTLPGDVLLLCSDGIRGVLNDEEIAEIIHGALQEGKSLEEAIQEVKNVALGLMKSGTNPDNIVIFSVKIS